MKIDLFYHILGLRMNTDIHVFFTYFGYGQFGHSRVGCGDGHVFQLDILTLVYGKAGYFSVGDDTGTFSINGQVLEVFETKSDVFGLVRVLLF